MDRQTFETAVFRKWADRYNCTIEDLKRPGTEIIPEDDFANSNAIHIWTIGERAFARMDPACEELARRALAAQPEGSALTADHVATAVTPHSIRKIEDNLLFYLYPPEFRPALAGEGFVLRQLTQDDVDALAALQAACAAAEAEEAEVSVEDEIGFGCFSGWARPVSAPSVGGVLTTISSRNTAAAPRTPVPAASRKGSISTSSSRSRAYTSHPQRLTPTSRNVHQGEEQCHQPYHHTLRTTPASIGRIPVQRPAPGLPTRASASLCTTGSTACWAGTSGLCTAKPSTSPSTRS